MLTPDHSTLAKIAIINAIASKDQAEIHRCKVARLAFLMRVLNDPRTVALFGQWRRDHRLDAIAVAWATELEQAAAAIGLGSRADLDYNETAYDGLPLETRRRFQEYDRLLTMAKQATADARAAAIAQFIGHVLYPQPPRLIWWLSYALDNYFDADLERAVWGRADVAMELVVGTLDQAPLARGQRPNDGKVERYVDWYYRARVASPAVSISTLAREHADARAEAGVSLGHRDARGISERPDTKEVRNRITEADRLLNGLVVPPDQAAMLLRNPKIQA